jgi:hypothetical protein
MISDGFWRSRLELNARTAILYQADVPEENDQFGYSLATGDFDRNGYCDLAIGVPYEDITHVSEPKTDAGGVHVLTARRSAWVTAM